MRLRRRRRPAEIDPATLTLADLRFLRHLATEEATRTAREQHWARHTRALDAVDRLTAEIERRTAGQ